MQTPWRSGKLVRIGSSSPQDSCHEPVLTWWTFCTWGHRKAESLSFYTTLPSVLRPMPCADSRNCRLRNVTRARVSMLTEGREGPVKVEHRRVCLLLKLSRSCFPGGNERCRPCWQTSLLLTSFSAMHLSVLALRLAHWYHAHLGQILRFRC